MIGDIPMSRSPTVIAIDSEFGSGGGSPGPQAGLSSRDARTPDHETCYVGYGRTSTLWFETDLLTSPLLSGGRYVSK